MCEEKICKGEHCEARWNRRDEDKARYTQMLEKYAGFFYPKLRVSRKTIIGSALHFDILLGEVLRATCYGC